MQNDEVSGESIDHSEADKTTKPRSHKKKLFIGVQTIAFAAGLALLVFLIYRTGSDAIIGSIAGVGWGFLLIVGLNLTRHLLRAASLYVAVRPEHRKFGYSSVLAARFGGEAINFFSFAGPFLGDAAKAVMLRKDLPLTLGASAIISDNILYYLSVILMVLAGVIALVTEYGSESRTMNNVLIGIVIVGVLLFVAPLIAIQRRIRPLSSVVRYLGSHGLAPQFVTARLEKIREVETNVVEFYHHRPRDFFAVFGIGVLTHAVSVTEVYLVLYLLGYQALVSNAYIIESLTKVINAAFSFIPGTIGVYEGGNGLIFKVLGYTTAMGITLALVRRGAILLTTVLGMSILLWRGTGTIARRRREKP